MQGPLPNEADTPQAAVYLPVAQLINPWFGRPHRATVIRWIGDGVRLPGGERVRLRAWRRGRIWLSTASAVAEFAQAVLTPSDGAQAPRTVATRRRAADHAAVELKALGM